MCGITFVFTKTRLLKGAHGWFWDALYADALRGFHSTGLMALMPDKKVSPLVLKKALAANDFLDLKRVDKVLSNYSTYSGLIGHNRHATKGAIIDKHAHPFQHGHITLVHNGSLWSHDDLPGNHTVDSEAIAFSISQQGVEETIKKLDGAFALIWHDSSDGTLNMIRNDKRPLSYGIIEGTQTVIGGSEGDMVKWITSRNKQKLGGELHSLEPGMLYTFNLEADDITKPRVRKMEMYSWQYPVDSEYSTGYYKNGTWYRRRNHTTISKKEESNKVIALPFGSIREKKLKELAEHIGVTLGDEVEFYLFEYEPYTGYSQRQNGVATGVSIDEPFHIIKVHNVEKSILDNRDDLYIGEIGAIQKGTKFEKNKEDYSLVIINRKKLEDVKAGGDSIIEGECTANSDEDESDGDSDDLGESLVIGPHGDVSIKEFDKLTRHGCGYCERDIMHEEHEDVKWMENGLPLCIDCQELMDRWSIGDESKQLDFDKITELQSSEVRSGEPLH